MAETTKSSKETKQRILYLTLVLGSCYLLFFIVLFGNKGSNSPIYQILQKGFTAFPVLAAIITRRVTKDKTPWRISIQESGLLGPNPTGLIGLSGLMILAITMFICFGEAKNSVGI